MNHFQKTSKKLERLRGSFFLTGIIIAGGLTLVAFEWTTSYTLPDQPKPPTIVGDDDFILPPITYSEPANKPEVKITQPKIDPTQFEIVPDETSIEPIDEPQKKEDPVLTFNPEKWKTPSSDPLPVEDAILMPGKHPYYKDCESSSEEERKKCTQEKMYDHFNNTTSIPQSVKIRGAATYKAFVYFEVNKKGEIDNVKILNGKKHQIPKELEREAYNAVASLPGLIPGKNHGKTVSVRYQVPISFIVR